MYFLRLLLGQKDMHNWKITSSSVKILYCTNNIEDLKNIIYSFTHSHQPLLIHPHSLSPTDSLSHMFIFCHPYILYHSVWHENCKSFKLTNIWYNILSIQTVTIRILVIKWVISSKKRGPYHLWVAPSETVSLSMPIKCRFTSSCTGAKYHPSLCSPFIHFVVR